MNSRETRLFTPRYSVVPQLVSGYTVPDPTNADHSQVFSEQPVYFSVGTVCGGESVPVRGTVRYLVTPGAGNGLFGVSLGCFDANRRTGIAGLFTRARGDAITPLVLVAPVR